jgi:hypothetical protein
MRYRKYCSNASGYRRNPPLFRLTPLSTIHNTLTRALSCARFHLPVGRGLRVANALGNKFSSSDAQNFVAIKRRQNNLTTVCGVTSEIEFLQRVAMVINPDSAGKNEGCQVLLASEVGMY